MLCEIKFDYSAITSEHVIIAIVGMGVVFASLIILFYLFSLVPILINIPIRNRLRKEGKIELAESDDLHIPADVSAAISLALHLHFNEMHDKEDAIITMKKITKKYSPWSSKLYSVYNLGK
ncbi:MAG TPA: hypothetical protein DDX39_09910 [Bacteroidales bacterium]|nr:MAG: hypothetical protein A2W98_01465 [Bacteroidetes bacterium GWF2_33_38]OFY75598.1 MAG: hypothetical protein A2265_00500 [Bacteroidetes bacterium RIFOXYA12_FULL_33_9]OFY85991.1 MAG: hypothetical protein A2236_10810 [Bacteroidetes bacterium RIFOXYA2_FULL_33_7]HBF88944.1 hypothetical protein [Bacteroidales bacterium]